jgi:AAA domain
MPQSVPSSTNNPTATAEAATVAWEVMEPASPERFRSLFEVISNVVVVKPPKTNWVDELGDFDDYDVPGRTWIQPGMIAEGCVTTIVAKTGHGKSLFGMKLAQAFTSAYELFGHQHPEREVLYLDRENKVQTLKNRRDWLGVKIHGRANPTSKLHYCSVFLNGTKEPDDPQVLEWAKRQSPPAVLFVDTLRGHLKKGQKENLTEDVRAFYGQFNKLLALGCAVVVMHHTGKGLSTKNGSGTEDIEGVSDYMFKIVNVTRDKAGKLSSAVKIKKMTLERLKGRDPHALWDEKVHIDISDDGAFTIGEAVKPKETEAESEETATAGDADKLTAIVEANPGITGHRFEKLAKEQHGIGQGAARDWRRAGVSDGSIVKRLGARGAMFLYLAGTEPAEVSVCSEGLIVVTEGG